MKKKLLYFSHGLSANGIETFLVNVLGRLNLEKYDVTVLIAIDEGVPSLHEQTVRDLGIKIINAGDMDSVKKKIAYIKNVKKELNSTHYDIVHSNMDLLNGITLFLAKRAGVKKRICHGHTTKTQYKSEGAIGKIMSCVQKIYSFVMKKLIVFSSTDLLSCSENASEYFYGNRPSKVIYNGIDLRKYSCVENTDGYIEKTFGIENKEKRIVSVGRISPVKNPLFALEVMNELKKLRSDFQYLWIGTGGLEAEAKARAEKMDLQKEVIFTGVRTDVPQIINCCDCFFMPSLFEGLPFSLVEAQAAGLKCIVSDVVSKTADVGLIEFFSLDKSAKEWAEFISEVLDKPAPEADAERMKKFDINYTVKQLEVIYDK